MKTSSTPTNLSAICVDDAVLAVTPPVNGVRLWLLGLHFDNGLADLDLVGLADNATADLFARVELLLVTTDRRFDHAIDRQVAALLIVSNDPKRWTDQPF